jgi:hypothetical protein
MKKPFIAAVLCGSLCASVFTQASAATFDYSNNLGKSIDLNPTDNCDGGGSIGCFSFSSGNSFQITSGSASGLEGGVNGLFGVGPISTSGPLETASVSGTGILRVFDGSFTLTADLHWVDIATFGVAGSLNTVGTANLSNVSYTGSNIDLLALAGAGSGTQTATFQFTNPTSLTDLFETRSTITSTSFSGSISTVPIPAAAWLFGSALLGLFGITRKQL